MKTFRSLVPLALIALALLLLPQLTTAGELPDMTLVLCSDGPTPASLQGGELLGDFEQEPTNKIQNGPCSWCTENSGCSTECIDENENQSTCGDYGVCDACREALVEIDRELIGQKAKTTFWGICEFKWYYNVTYQSLNSSSCQTYTYCETETETHTFNPYDLWCCDEIPGGCFGSRCP